MILSHSANKPQPKETAITDILQTGNETDRKMSSRKRLKIILTQSLPLLDALPLLHYAEDSQFLHCDFLAKAGHFDIDGPKINPDKPEYIIKGSRQNISKIPVDSHRIRQNLGIHRYRFMAFEIHFDIYKKVHLRSRKNKILTRISIV